MHKIDFKAAKFDKNQFNSTTLSELINKTFASAVAGDSQI